MIVCGKIARGWARCAQVLLTNHVQTNDFTNREAIELARAQEAKTRELQRCLKASMSLLHKAIQLSGDDASDALFDFVRQDIDQVPDLPTAPVRVLKVTGVYKQGELLVAIVDGFFVNSPEIDQQYGGLQALIAKTYLAHRLVEEMNDRLVLLGRLRLIPVDMTSEYRCAARRAYTRKFLRVFIRLIWV